VLIGRLRRAVDIKSFLQTQSRSASVVERAVADNCRFDERSSADRWNVFEGLLDKRAVDPGAIDWADWGEAYKDHFETRVKVPSGSAPDAFLDINRTSWLPRVVGDQWVVRIETLTKPLADKRLSLGELEGLLTRGDSGRDSDARAAVEEFFEAWNRMLDARPAFCVPLHEIDTEVADADWAHALRDRLGLGHYGLPGGAGLDIALMRYEMSDVIASQKAARIPTACALPTALDGGMHQFFFPVPREHPFGATVHLAPGKADTLTAEWLHCRIEYKRKHLVKLGRILRPHGVHDPALVDARDLHLLSLQIECTLPDFGEPLKGRV
jgi:hypothetical protein